MGQKVILAVDIGGSKYVVGLVAGDGTVLCKRKYRWREISPASVVEEICLAMERMLREHPGADIRAVGMTIPGLADPEKGVWISASFMGIYDLPIGEIVRERFGLPVYIENDCNACALAEKMYGRCRNVRDFLYITVSNSIGGALFIGGQLYRGAKGNAGEVGLIHVSAGDGPGGSKRDALENYASGRGLAAAYLALGGQREIGGAAPDGEGITRLAREQDLVALEAFRLEGEYLGQAIAGACALLDPELVIIGGGLSLAFDQYEGPLRERVRWELHLSTGSIPDIFPTALGYDGGLIGAAAVAVRQN